MLKWILVSLISFSSLLNAETKVLAFAGSSREDSTNKKLIAVAAEFAKQKGAQVTIVDLKDYPIPFYDGDLEVKEGMPANAKTIRHKMVESDVILIASPSYNGSVSGLLKNFIDWASRSETGGPSREAFQGKKFVLLSASPGPSGGKNGLVHLRQIIENIGGTVLPEEVSIPDAYNAFDDKGNLKSETQKCEVKNLIDASLSK